MQEKQKFAPDSIPHIKRDALPISIMEILTDCLLSGELKPGDKLPTEVELAQRLGVGRNSVREAVKMLSSLGVIETVRGSGIYIARSMSAFTLNPLILSLVFEQGTSEELIKLRVLLDTGAAELALEHINDDDLHRLEAVNGQLKVESQQSPQNKRRLGELDLMFHKELYRISGNRLLAKIGEAIYKLFYASIEKTVETDPEGAHKNHQMIIESLKNRNPEQVRESTKQSLRYWMQYLGRTDA